MANILSTDNYITHEQVTQSVSIVWVQYYLSDRFIKYLFYSLTFGDIWIQFIAIFIYFEILMNYLHTNVHISEFSKKCVYLYPYFLGDLVLRTSTTFRDRFLYYKGHQYDIFTLFSTKKKIRLKKRFFKKSKCYPFLPKMCYIACFRTLKIALFIDHFIYSVLDNVQKTCYR